MTIGVADVMKYFNQGKMQWWGWEDTSAGEVYSNLKFCLLYTSPSPRD